VSLLHHTQGQLLLCVLGLLLLTMLQRLLVMLSQQQLHRDLTHAASLQGQLQLLLQCVVRPLGVPHNRWTLAFEDARLEDRYRKVGMALCCTLCMLRALSPPATRHVKNQARYCRHG
jgi:hypothetical protein